MKSRREVVRYLKSNNVVGIGQLIEQFNYSESKIRKLLRDLRNIGEENGFEIVSSRGIGYSVKVNDMSKLATWLDEGESIPIDVTIREQRLDWVIYLLLETDAYISVNEISEALDVSRGTVLNDLKSIKKVLIEYNLKLESKQKYGNQVIGDEFQIRRLFMSTVDRINKKSRGNIAFSSLKKDETIVNILKRVLDRNDVVISNSALESIRLHLEMLIYRIRRSNYISELYVDRDVIDEKFYRIAIQIRSELEREFCLEINEFEIDLIAAQVFGKASLDQISNESRDQQYNMIQSTLSRIDKEYGTDYKNDNLLVEGLLLHIYPLLSRVAFSMELNNSLISSLPAQFTSSFIIAMKFNEYHGKLQNHKLSRDELGYLALHFAAHNERALNDRIKNIRNILFFYDGLRSSPIYIKSILQSTFVNSRIKVLPLSKIDKYSLKDVDLIISSSKINESNVKHIQINESLDDDIVSEDTVKTIVNMLSYDKKVLHKRKIGVMELFTKELFYIEESRNYFNILEKYSKEMEINEYAKVGFMKSVLERENRFSTIYDNGIAGPHSLKPLGIKDSICVILLKPPIESERKEVRYIFLINIMKGHMFLHHEISEFLVGIMNDKFRSNALSNVKTYSEFIELVK